MLLDAEAYCLTNARIPQSLIDLDLTPVTREGLCAVDLEIRDGKIDRITPLRSIESELPQMNLEGKIVLPCFVDLHTHLDKGHIWERSPNLDGTFATALKTAIADSQQYWQAEDIYRRMEFGLGCSYAHGTQAIRTHIDAYGEQAAISFSVWQQLQQKWFDKLTMQAVSLVSLDYYQTDEGKKLADLVAEVGGILGGVAVIDPQLDVWLDRVFELAIQRNLDLDFHADENGNPDSICLWKIAQAAIRNKFTGKIICGHCCSLAVQPPEIVDRTLAAVKEAGIAVVSLPMCNLYLQDRQDNVTPYWRGVTRVKELQQHGIPVAFASDNCRDPFYGFGDLDMLEVFDRSVNIAQLDTPYGNWIDSVTKTPASLMDLNNAGKIAPRSSANLIIFKARYFSELLSRSQHDRIVLREGKQIDTTLPDYEVLDDLVF
jgi:cytosine/creatinine deaminase